MTTVEKTNLKKILIYFTLFTATILGIHLVIQSQISSDQQMKLMFVPYVYNFTFYLAVVFWLRRVKNESPEKVAYHYLALSVLRFLSALILLLPFILEKSQENKVFSLHFMSVFLLYLFFEAFIVVKNFLPKD